MMLNNVANAIQTWINCLSKPTCVPRASLPRLLTSSCNPGPVPASDIPSSDASVPLRLLPRSFRTLSPIHRLDRRLRPGCPGCLGVLLLPVDVEVAEVEVVELEETSPSGDNTQTTHKQHTNNTQTTHKQHTNNTQTTHRQHTDNTQTTHKQHTDNTQTTHTQHTREKKQKETNTTSKCTIPCPRRIFRNSPPRTPPTP